MGGKVKADYTAAEWEVKKAKAKAHAAAHPEQVAASKAKWRAKAKAGHLQWQREKVELTRMYNRRWYRSNLEAAKNNQRRKNEVAGRVNPDNPPQPTTAVKRARRAKVLHDRAYAAVPAGVPRHVRDDAVAAVLLALMDGKITEIQIEQHAKRCLTDTWGLTNAFNTVSLDATVPGTDSLRLIDTIASDREHF